VPLLDLGFFVQDVLTNLWVVLHQFQFLVIVSSIFCCRVEMTSSGGRLKLDDISVLACHGLGPLGYEKYHNTIR